MAIDYTKDRAYRFFDQGKVEGTWNPDDIDISQDEEDWEEFTEEERSQFLRLGSGFYDGEENVTRTLAPYLLALDNLDEGRLAFDPVHVEMYLSQQIYDEAKHTDFFGRWYDRVVGHHDTDQYRLRSDDDNEYATENLYPLGEELTRTALDADHTEILHKLGEAVMVYMGLIEGQSARGGYIRFDQMRERKAEQLGREEVLPGFGEAISLIRDDEGRHIGHGQWLLGRIAESDPAVVEEIYQPMFEDYIETRILNPYDADRPTPFEIDREAVFEASINYMQETIDIIGRERFDDRFQNVDEFIRDRRTATADD